MFIENKKGIRFPTIPSDVLEEIICFLYFRFAHTNKIDLSEIGQFEVSIPFSLDELSAASYLNLLDLAELCAKRAAQHFEGNYFSVLQI